MKSLQIEFSWQHLVMFLFFIRGNAMKTCRPGQLNDVSQYFYITAHNISRLSDENIIFISSLSDWFECGALCLDTRFCVGYNFKKNSITGGQINCQLTYTTDQTFERVSTEDNDWTFYKTEGERISGCEEENKCQNGGKMAWDPVKPFKCQCLKGYFGDLCENKEITSCKDVFDNNSSAPDGVYYLKSNESSEIHPVYCQISSFSAKCGGGGWTLVMKLDKNKTTFEYNSQFWTNKETLNVDAGLDGLTQNETKLASYHNKPFTKICLGMSQDTVTNWILVNYTATSLYSVIADGNCRKVDVGRAEWMSLVNGNTLELNCNKEGFNVECSDPERKSRIGILGNNQDDCTSCSSVIGFGFEMKGQKWSSGHSFGINGLRIPTFGYIFVQ